MSVLCSDKTGTLTENALTVTTIRPMPGFDEAHVLALAALASSDGGQDPVDRAIRSAALGKAISDAPKVIKFVPFDPGTKMSEATAQDPGGGTQRIVKGAFAAVIGLTQPLPSAAAASKELEAKGFRVLAVAAGPPNAMKLAGLIALSDPPRKDSAALITLTLKPTDYGLGVHASNRFSVERYVRGHMIGCDVFSNEAERIFIGINDKLMFTPPSFAMRGSCFPSDRYDISVIRDYAFDILDAVNFDFGASHIEMIVAEDGPYLVEVNPRLVSAQIPHQMGYALERSLYADLINLHLGLPITKLREVKPRWFSAIRWVIADRPGILKLIQLPDCIDDSI